MNERPTPETDQFKVKLKTTCGEKYWVPVEHSERLERERDEARNLACVYQHQYYMHVHPNSAVPYFSWEKGPKQ